RPLRSRRPDKFPSSFALVARRRDRHARSFRYCLAHGCRRARPQVSLSRHGCSALIGYTIAESVDSLQGGPYPPFPPAETPAMTKPGGHPLRTQATPTETSVQARHQAAVQFATLRFRTCTSGDRARSGGRSPDGVRFIGIAVPVPGPDLLVPGQHQGSAKGCMLSGDEAFALTAFDAGYDW